MILLSVALFAFFAVMSNGISLKPKNLVNIVSAMSISAFLTTGITMLMISGRLDLSTGANGTLCGMVLAFIMRAGMPLVPALLIALGVGAFIGLINAFLVNELRIAPFIATLATSSIATGCVYILADKKIVEVTSPVLIGYGKHILSNYIPVCSLIAFIFMIIAGVILHRTTFGRKIYMVGGNPQAAMLSGINPKKMSYTLFIICGIFAAMAGITFVSRMQSANLQGISAARFQGITAAVLGGIAFGGGTGGMAGAFIGLLVLNTFSNGMNIIGISPNWQNVAQGLLLIFALTMDYFQKKSSLKSVA